MPKANKVTSAEKERRILIVQGWIIDSAQDNFMLRQMMNEWNISLRQARRYLKDAYSRWLPMEQLTIEEQRAAKIAELQQLKRTLKPEFTGTPQGINAIHSIDRTIIKLKAIQPPKRMDLNINNAPVIQVVDVAKQKPDDEK